MIITKLQNYIKLNTNSIANAGAPTSFTSKNQLNSDIFVHHDENSVPQQYLQSYEPGKISEFYYANPISLNKAIEELNSKELLNYNWIFGNSSVVNEIYGSDFKIDSANTDIFIRELNSNREKIGEQLLETLKRKIEKRYKILFPVYQFEGETSAKVFDLDTLGAYNLAMSRFDYDKIAPKDISLFYRTTNPIDIKKLKKYTKANIIDARDKFGKELFSYDKFDELVKTAQEEYNRTGKRSIILLKDLYKNLEYDHINNSIYRCSMKLKNNYEGIFVSEDILPTIAPYPKFKENKQNFSNIPTYGQEKQKFIEEILKPIDNNDIDAPKYVVFSSNTTPKDTREFLSAGLNKKNYAVYQIKQTTNINDFGAKISDIKTKVEQNNTPNMTTFIIIPQAYKYIAGKPENIELIKSLQNSSGNKIIPILYSSFTDKLLEKMQFQSNSYKEFTLNALEEKELEQLLKLYVNKIDDEINDLITSGREIEPINIDMDYEILAKMLKRSSHSGFNDIKDYVEDAKNSYLTSQMHTFKEYLYKSITGGTNNEN